MVSLLFFVLAGLAIACSILMVYHKNPLYSAISLIGVFIALACIYLLLAAPFIAVTQVLVYAGAIMVLVIFVIMLLNLEEDKPLTRLRYLYLVGIVLGLALFLQTLFIYQAVKSVSRSAPAEATAGLTMNIGRAMFTEYLLPVEIVGVLLLMAIVGAMILSRKNGQFQSEEKKED
ncbi:MAG: NADH-quinone oxidoreductase subunit J [Pyrinomonadaceae bacterium]|nr:NADH-quinone oxidoreductase subunit J [Pyrinomonadaceae bacterium]MCX7640476.1 NADH-quinone oxidoreductase subunit J [Pyrinomonadaceae bacterium]MDW8305171.1 NADH-quinone oxidoreductase subunit J [Acidobacteriota bacterium]